MACILKDNYKYAPDEPRPEIPKEPICASYYPPEVEKQAETASLINLFVFLILYGIVLPCLAACCLPIGKGESTEGWIFFGIGSCVLYFINWVIDVLIKRYLNKQISDPKLKIKKMNNIMFPPPVLKDNDLHFIKHLEYYRITGSWIMPD